MKKSKKSLLSVFGMSMLLGFGMQSHAELLENKPLENSIAWSEAEVGQFLNEAGATEHIEISPPGAVTVTTTVRSVQGNVLTDQASQSSATKTTILDTSYLSHQPDINSRAALVMDAATGEVLYSKNSNKALPIASITKLMTAVVIADAKLNMSEEIKLISADFSCSGCKSSSSTLRVGDSMNRAEALLFALMKSENPAAAALARTYPGGRAAFITAMNNKAKALGMHSSKFMESTGLHPGNVASARDLGILVNSASQYGLIRQFSTTPSYDFNLGYRVLKSNNTNALVRNGGWNINISKTGFINEAGRCVVMHTTLNNRPVAVVLLGANNSQARTNDAVRLMNWTTKLPKAI